MKLDCTPNAKGRWCLEQLVDGPLQRWEILKRAQVHFTKKGVATRAIPNVLGALQIAGLVTYGDRREYAITADGLQVLARLCAGETVEIALPGEAAPNVRVFARKVAA